MGRRFGRRKKPEVAKRILEIPNVRRQASAMKQPGTMYTGPLGSTFHVLHAESETVTALATIDWNRHFRRVCLDRVRGLITLMSPSFSHEDLTGLLDDIVEIAGEKLAGTVRVLRSTRLRRRGDPPGSDPRKLDASWVLGGLTPEDVCETVEGVRDGETRDDRTKAVERIVQRRQDGSVRVREETAAYSAGQAATEHEPDAARAAPENVHMDDAVPHRPGQRAT